jgi:hypothetical protein
MSADGRVSTPPLLSPWLGRYHDPLPIRSRGSFHIVSADPGTGERRTVVVPGPGADARRVEEAFAEIERAHALFSHPRVPAVTARGRTGEVPFLELGCDTVMDGVDVVRLIGDSEEKMPYPSADGFIAGTRMALESAHTAVDPRSGGPLCLGRLSYANYLFSPDGRWWLIGFGCNFPIERDSGAPDAWVASFHAPEMSTGGSPSPIGDFAALLLFMRSMLPYAETSGTTLARILRGEVQPSDLELIECLRWFDQHILAEIPQRRPSMREAVAVSDRIRELMGVRVDLEGFDAFIAGLLRRQEESEPLAEKVPPSARGVTIGPEASWVAGPDGQRQPLGRAQRRIVKAFAERHRREPAATLTMWDVLEAGWPGEQPVFEAGANRVYVTIARLRRLGLREVIERFEDGYRFSPEAVIRFTG